MVYGPGGSVLVTPMFSPQRKVAFGGWETVLRVVYSSVMLLGYQLNTYILALASNSYFTNNLCLTEMC